MANKVFSLRDSSMRIVDGTANTPLYVSCLFREGGGSFPLGHARGEEQTMMHQGKADSNTHSIKMNDAPTWEPLEGSFSGLLYDNNNTLLLIPALSNPFAGTWTVGSSTFAAVTVGNLVNLDGTSVAGITPVDSERNNLVNLEILWDNDSTDWGLKYNGCHFPPEQLQISDDFPTKFEATFQCFGPVTKITTHTTPATAVTVS